MRGGWKTCRRNMAGSQRAHYDRLVKTRRPTRYLLSCGFDDRYDPALLDERPALRNALTSLFDRVLPPTIGTMLDLACGTAYYWPLLAPRCERLLGAELSPAMAAVGRAHLHDEQERPALMVSSEAGHLPFSASSIDVVLAIDALHHVDELPRVVDEIERLLRPGGLLVAIEPNVFNPVVFAAHMIPSEERGALWPNHPWAVMRALRRAFDDVTVTPVTYVSGIQSPRALHLVERLEPLFHRRPLSAVSLRRVYSARRS